MSTTAQTEANRRNAQASTGPRTEAGNAASSQNASKLHLFSTRNFVLPQDEAEYQELTTQIWEELNPQTALEGVHAIEILRSTWRLRRCAVVESSLVEKLLAQVSSAETTADTPDAMLCQNLNAIQISVDRARTQAGGMLNRATAELRRLQSERRIRLEAHPSDFEPTFLGISDSRIIGAGIAAHVQACVQLGKVAQNEQAIIEREAFCLPDIDYMLKQFTDAAQTAKQAAAPAKTKPTQTPRNAACTCGSGLKFKRCCGIEAPPVLQQTAAA